MTYKPSFWQKLISWLYPLAIEIVPSKISGRLEVNLQYGQVAIDSPKANYSFGNLHLVYREALSAIDYDFSKQYKVLILGFGAGSIAHILRNEIGINCAITAVELDEEIIKLSKKYFASNLFRNTKLHIQDAADFISKCTQKFDLVCVDLFIDTEIPIQFQEEKFLKNLKKVLGINSFLFMNSMDSNKELKANWLKVYSSEKKISIQENEVLLYQQ